MAVTATPLNPPLPTTTQPDDDFSNNDLLVKVRSQTNSGLENQKQAAIILTAVEETIKEQNEQLTPLAYFGTLMTILEQQRATPGNDSEKLGILVAVTYLLAIVFPRIPTTVLRVKFEDIGRTLGGTLEAYQEEQPLVRSILACFEFLLLAQDNARWNGDATIKKLFQVLLIMSVDGRPKVRRRAHEAVKRILSRPPPPSTHHPATITTIDFSVRSLEEYAASVGNANAKDRKELEQQVLHVLVFLKMTLPVLAMQGGHDKTRGKLRTLCETLLKLPVRSSGTGNTVLTQWIFGVLETLFGAGAEKEGIFPHLDMTLMDSVIRALLEIRPYQNDATLIPAWLELIGRGFSKLAELARDAEKDTDEMASVERQYAINDYPKLFVSVFSKTYQGILSQQSTKPVIITKAAEVFSAMVRECITETMIQEAERESGDMGDGEQGSQLLSLIQVIDGSLSDIRYRAAWGGILKLAEAVFERLGSVRPHFVRGTLVNVMAFRDDAAYGESFPYKEELEVALHAAVQGFGLEKFVEFVPMNIENELPGQPRRPYLLSTFVQGLNRPLPTIVGSAPSAFGPHALRFLGKVLLPLAQRMFEKSGNGWVSNRGVEAKLYETLGAQIMALVPGLCSTVPPDVAESFAIVGPYFGRILQSQPAEAFENLPSNPDFRPVVCEALQSLVEGYQSAAKLDENEKDDQVSAQQKKDAKTAKKGLAKLKEYATHFLSVLCNNYTTIQPEVLESTKGKGQALQSLHERENQHYAKTIKTLLAIADEEAITSYFINLVTTLLQSQSQEHEEGESVVAQLGKLRDYAILDLLLILLPFLPEVRNRATILPDDSPLLLFYKVLIGQLRDADPTLQKRTYKSLNHILPHIPSKSLSIPDLVSRLLDPSVLSLTTSGAKNARIQVLQRVALSVPISQKELLLEFVPVALSEVMLATKEASEKARHSAYECLVAMGRKMLTGGVQTESGTWDMESLALALSESDVKEGQVNLREYFMMVIAGLAGETSTMQSAAIASLSRLVFEFGGLMDESLLQEVITTVTFVTGNSKNREVVKSALGFLKVVIVCLRQEILEDELENIVVAILAASQGHKSAFKSKVRHIFERLVRKFSYEAIEGFVPESDKKLLTNIRKRREREKKKKALARQQQLAQEGDNDSDGEVSKAALSGGKAAPQKMFEEAMYGSESELSDQSDDDDYIPEQFRDGLVKDNKKGVKNSKTMIREDGDVADFLDSRIVSRVATAPKRSKRGNPDTEFGRGEDGRLMIAESDSDENEGEAMEETPAEDHYKSSLHSEVAFTRTPSGQIRFLKETKRKRNDSDDEGEKTGNGLGWGQNPSKHKKDVGLNKTEIDKMLGRQFKAKRARGDVKTVGGPDPFAYIPLTSKVVGGKKRKAAKVAGQFRNIIKASQKNTEVGATVKGGKGGGVRKGNKKHK